jgi:single-strand DNA-binding protein
MNPIVTLVGNVVTEPEVRFTPGGKAVANVTVVTKDVKKDGDQWMDVNPTFYRVTLWERVAEQVAEANLVPGTEVIVVGKQHVEEYEKDGEKRKNLVVSAYQFGVSINKRATVRLVKAEKTDTTTAAADPWAAADDNPPF